MAKITISVPDEMLEDIDEAVSNDGYVSSRSEAFRFAFRREYLMTEDRR